MYYSIYSEILTMDIMMKFISLLLLFVSVNVSANSLWNLEKDNKLSELDPKKSVEIIGVITSIKKEIQARDSIFHVKIKDENSDLFIKATIYTINWLKRVNQFDCNEGDIIALTAPIEITKDGDYLGKIVLKSKAKKLECRPEIKKEIEVK